MEAVSDTGALETSNGPIRYLWLPLPHANVLIVSGQAFCQALYRESGGGTFSSFIG